MSARNDLDKLAKLIRYYILISTNEAGSGHPTSALSATDLMTGLMFGGTFRYDAENPLSPYNDRMIFSKGHATPLLYSLWTAAGKLTEQELLTYRKFGSPLEGHPTASFPYAEAATGSLGQGLSIGVGLALGAKYVDRLPCRSYVLIGDSEMAEGSQWEALEIASFYKLDNLVGILDVNRLGQRGETMYGHDLSVYEKRVSAFGWETILIDGHNMDEITNAYERAIEVKDKPVMIIAKTIKGKGVLSVEDQNGWHGKPLDKERFAEAMKEFAGVDKAIRGDVPKPENRTVEKRPSQKAEKPSYDTGKAVATRKAYGLALKRIFPQFPDMVVLDGEVSNSTYSEIFRDAYPERYFEMYIAEQNMVGAALGLQRVGKLPFVSTFAAFFSRAYDQIRMCQYSGANIKFCGSHAGVSIGEDGPSQMGLEDIAMFRSIINSVVLYPSDAVSTDKLVEEAAAREGMVYIRTTRKDTPVIYNPDEEFPIGGSKVLKQSDNDVITVAAAGITLHEALAAYEELQNDNIFIRVIDLYSIKPIDVKTLKKAGRITSAIITVEDHHIEGGMGEAVRTALADFDIPVHSLAVEKVPKSGKPAELLDYENISKNAIVKKVKALL
ncbi:MAG: transketolase [Nitrospirae bacterium]|nr:transketolase [Nitrospirota bacterium]